MEIPTDSVPDRNAPTATPNAITVDPEPMASDKKLEFPQKTADPAVITPDTFSHAPGSPESGHDKCGRLFGASRHSATPFQGKFM